MLKASTLFLFAAVILFTQPVLGGTASSTSTSTSTSTSNTTANTCAALATVPCSIPVSRILWLVNYEHTLPPSYAPVDLMNRGDGYGIHPEACAAFDQMHQAMKEAGIHNMRIQSAYRTYDQQRRIFHNKRRILLGHGYNEAKAAELASRIVAQPGASEHQTGLAIDVTVDGTLNRSFAKTKAGRWIDEHAHEYGFIVRYPDGKTHITGILYEPWHLRYVGLPHAAFMKEKGFCYEEYRDYLKTTGLYVFWLDELYYLVEYADKPAVRQPYQTVSISEDGYGKGARYIITYLKNLSADAAR